MPQIVAVIGLGYIGLPTAVVLANTGVYVVGVDVDADKVEAANNGTTTFVEPGLTDELAEALSSGRFRASTEVPEADAYIVAVPTPPRENNDVDNSYIYSAADAISRKLRGNELVILESTSPPGTTETLARRISEARPDLAVHGIMKGDGSNCVLVAHCPERILPGNALAELRANDRVIGGLTPPATERAKEIYGSFCRGELLATDATTAEMTKLTENSFRDVNIAFANELSLICDQHGVDVWELIRLANHHPRVNILQPGPGVGGHCIAVDPWFIISSAPEASRLIRTARGVNDFKPQWVVDKIKEAAIDAGGDAIAVLGLAFKANIDDLRESPAVEICESLATEFPERRIIAVEPNIRELPTLLKSRENIELDGLDCALSQASVVALLVDHDEFKALTPGMFKGKRLIDTKGAISA